MRFPEDRLRRFFQAFFALPLRAVVCFLTNTNSLPDLVGAMLRLFATAPADVRTGLMLPQGRELGLMARILAP